MNTGRSARKERLLPGFSLPFAAPAVMSKKGFFMQIEYFVPACGVEHGRLCAALPEDDSLLRPVLRVRAALRTGRAIWN